MSGEALVVIVGGTRCALPMERVLEVRVYEGATRLPGTPGWVRGIVEREGVPVEVIDAARRLDPSRAADASPSARPCVVFFDQAAMLVDDVDRLMALDALEDDCALLDLDAFFDTRNDG
jgi:chemotaxis signal transduction protein